ncbi:hypothetical protein E2C01_091410 [Portunus trituberculatus]|uniref:Uncharacterized protein n=1 Tax=Portunus trituberculatus TaxID=210409 RepID=A0A5B7JSV1_PORTR|nr:hypothetical protein [Portunus trituberculatus]
METWFAPGEHELPRRRIPDRIVSAFQRIVPGISWFDRQRKGIQSLGYIIPPVIREAHDTNATHDARYAKLNYRVM